MGELLRNAVQGWQRYSQDGKLAVLFLGALVYLWFRVKKERGEKRKRLLYYATVSAVLVLFPVTAVLLMVYQTRFYEYEWIWALAPITLVIAFAGTSIYLDICRDYWKTNNWKRAGWAILGLAVLVLSGNLGGGSWDAAEEAEEAQKAEAVLDYVTENGKNKDICLWAPQEIMAYARQKNGSVRLPYGRNMWEEALNAYSYDSYTEETEELCRWMEALRGETGDGAPAAQRGEKSPEAEDCVRTAVGLGVNVVLLPDSTASETVREFELALAENFAGNQGKAGSGTVVGTAGGTAGGQKNGAAAAESFGGGVVAESFGGYLIYRIS